jgi:hypothetical protein
MQGRNTHVRPNAALEAFSRLNLASERQSLWIRNSQWERTLSFARSSSVRPSSTTPSSIAGSSKKVAQPSCGRNAAAELTPSAETAPTATSVFMSGRRARSAVTPSERMLRPA